MNINEVMSSFVIKLNDEITEFRVKYGKEPKVIQINPTTLFMLNEYLKQTSLIYKEPEVKEKENYDNFKYQGIELQAAAFIEINKIQLLGNYDIEMNRLYNN